MSKADEINIQEIKGDLIEEIFGNKNLRDKRNVIINQLVKAVKQLDRKINKE